MKNRELEAIQEQVEEQIDQISYELQTTKTSCSILKNYIEERLVQTPSRRELRRSTQHCLNVLENLIDLMGNVARS